MNMTLIMTAVVLVLLLCVIGAAAYGISRLKRGIRDFSRQVFGTDSLKEGFDRVEEEYQETPKSVSAMTGLYLPKIKKDFPQFQYDDMRVRAENVLTSYLMAVSAADQGLLKEGSQELRDQLEMKIVQQKNSGEREHFEKVRIHRTEITDYKKREGRCTVMFQTSLQYRYYVTAETGELVRGSRDREKQTRYNTELVYIQDREKVQDERDLSLGINCPNCGAPISGLGEKVCAYCGTPVVELNLYAWTFHRVTEV